VPALHVVLAIAQVLATPAEPRDIAENPRAVVHEATRAGEEDETGA